MDDALFRHRFIPNSLAPCPGGAFSLLHRCGLARTAADLPTFATGERSAVDQVRRDERVTEMLKMARELAAHGHRVQMIEAMLAANGYPEAPEFIDQPHIRNELRDIALRAGRRDEAERSIREH